MPMNDNFAARIMANELDSMVMRIEALPAHDLYTTAQAAVQTARDALRNGASDLHQQDMRKRFAKV